MLCAFYVFIFDVSEQSRRAAPRYLVGKVGSGRKGVGHGLTTSACFTHGLRSLSTITWSSRYLFCCCWFRRNSGRSLGWCSLRTASTTSSLAAAAVAALRLAPDGTRARGWSHLRGNLDDLLLKICCCCSAGTLVSWLLVAGSRVRLRGRTSLPLHSRGFLTFQVRLMAVGDRDGGC